MEKTHFSVEVVESKSGQYVRLKGELDLCAAEVLACTVDALATPPHAVDLSEVRFLDAAALNAILRVLRHLEASGHDLALVRPSPPVRRVFGLVGLSHLLAHAEAADVPM